MLSAALLCVFIAILAGITTTLWQARQAQQNSEALLSLLNVAAPQTFVGQEPTVGDYLIASAQQIELQFADQPTFRARALAEVGNGLINLGRSQDAQKALLRALTNAHQAKLSPESTFQLMRLLADTMDPPSELALALTWSDKINALLDRAPSSAGINALSTISNTLSKHGERPHLQANLSRMDSLIGVLALNVSDRENLLRQRGKISMRQHQFIQAMRYFSESAAAQHAHGAAFSAMRVAEAQFLLAQAALGANNTTAASSAWRAAEPAFLKNYAANDPPMLEFQALGVKIRKAAGPP